MKTIIENPTVSRSEINSIAAELKEFGIVEVSKQNENNFPTNLMTPQEAVDIYNFATSRDKYNRPINATSICKKIGDKKLTSKTAALISHGVYGIHQFDFATKIIPKIVDPENYLDSIEDTLEFKTHDFKKIKNHFELLNEFNVITLPKPTLSIPVRNLWGFDKLPVQVSEKNQERIYYSVLISSLAVNLITLSLLLL